MFYIYKKSNESKTISAISMRNLSVLPFKFKANSTGNAICSHHIYKSQHTMPNFPLLWLILPTPVY